MREFGPEDGTSMLNPTGELSEYRTLRRRCSVVGVSSSDGKSSRLRRPPVGWLAGRLVGRSVGRSVSRSVGQSVGRSVGQSVSRSVGRSVGQSVSQSVGQSVGQFMPPEGGTQARFDLNDGCTSSGIAGSLSKCWTRNSLTATSHPASLLK
jgi:hypothetical protein